MKITIDSEMIDELLVKDDEHTIRKKISDYILVKHQLLGKTEQVKVEPEVIRTNIEFWCEECETICAVYEQGLSCSCDNRWETEVLDPEDYPKKWKKVKVNICSV